MVVMKYIGLLVSLLSTIPAVAAFRCGPHALTYSVKSNSGKSGAGVRCVVIEQEQTNREQRITWYGEGNWDDSKYRHLGHYGYDMQTNRYHVFAAGIQGQGETTLGRTQRLNLSRKGDPMRPTSIEVSGDWSETWYLQSSGTHLGYSTSLKPLQSCGPFFHEFKVVTEDGRIGKGVRCELPHNQPLLVMLSGGYWGQNQINGRRYLDLITSPDLHSSGAFGLCDPLSTDFCRRAEDLKIWTVGGGTPSAHLYAHPWKENWYQVHRALPW